MAPASAVSGYGGKGKSGIRTRRQEKEARKGTRAISPTFKKQLYQYIIVNCTNTESKLYPRGNQNTIYKDKTCQKDS
jgi:hypothetical protein